MKRLLLPVLASAAFATGCVAHGDVGGGYTYGYASAGYATPDLYYVSPGVSVVAYSEYPTFYSDNYYWMYTDGVWYRSSYYGGGWAVSYDVPYHVRSINNPRGYTRFQPGQGWTRVGGSGNYRGSYNPRGYNPRPNAGNPPPAAYSPPAGGRARGGYQAPAARSTGGGNRNGGTYSPPSRGSGPTVRDHRHR